MSVISLIKLEIPDKYYAFMLIEKFSGMTKNSEREKVNSPLVD